MTIPILAHFRQQATERGIPDDEVDGFWEDHCERARTDGVDPGGKRWVAFLDAIVKSGNADARALSRAASDLVAKRRKLQREARARKKAEDEAYAAEAMSLPQWLESLRNSGETLSLHEQALVDAGQPQGAPGAWMFGILAGTPTAPRDAICASTVAGTGQECGLPVESWSRDGHIYRGARCAEHPF